MSFVVIAHNEEPTIAVTLASILAQSDIGGREVVVVDDGSADATARIVAELAEREPDVRLIRLGVNRGRGYARREGIAAARGRLIATVDADIVLPPEWLDRCHAELEQADAVCGTAVPDGDVAFLHTAFALSPRPVNHSAQVTGSNALYRREVFDAVAYDPELRDGEDVALSHAMDERGVAMRTVQGLMVDHRESKSARESAAWMVQSGRGATRQLLRYRELRAPDLATAAWLGSLLGPALAAGRLRGPGRRRRLIRTAALAAPGLFTTVAGALHLLRAFRFEPRRAPRFAAAVAADSAMLTLYFCGRVLGLPAALRGARDPR